ncbi:MAG TPA: galactokinase, partial [Anaerolineaceae bacterium]|nr:galactokinase [Anaerolineaceae bacterium]
RRMHLEAKPGGGSEVILHARDLGETVCFSLNELDGRRTNSGEPLPHWALYPAGVAWAAQQRGLPVAGIEAAYTSDIPIGAGLSSSAAVEVGFAALWRHLCGWAINNLMLAQLSQQAENEYVGVKCGLMDQFACANGLAGHALLFDTRSLDFRPLPLPEGVVIIIADSSIRRRLSGSAYNDRRAACEQAVELLRRDLPDIRALRDVSRDDFQRLAHKLPPVVEKRARHIVEEINRVDAAVGMLSQGDAAGFGRLMLAAHASLRDLYEVSIPELDVLVDIATGLPGCWGARLTGAGFGGCTVNLVQQEQSEAFIHQLKEGYEKATDRQAEVYLCQASRGVQVERLG